MIQKYIKMSQKLRKYKKLAKWPPIPTSHNATYQQ